MATLFEFQQRLSLLNNRKLLELILFTEIKKAEKQFVKAQKDQLSKGESGTGKIIGTYSFATQQIASEESTRQPKIAGQPYNFEYYGGFFDGMRLDVFEDKAEFWSSDSKTPLLVTKYKDLFGLQPEPLQKMITAVIYPRFMKEIRKILKLAQ